MDGVAVDVFGNLYALLPATSELVQIDRSGVTLLAGAGDGLSMPASLTFGARGDGRRTLFITNFSLPDFVPAPTPGVIALNVPFPRP